MTNDYLEIINEQNRELAKFRPFKSAYEMKKEIERLNNIINKIVNIYESKDTTEDVYFALEELFEKENIRK